AGCGSSDSTDADTASGGSATGGSSAVGGSAGAPSGGSAGVATTGGAGGDAGTGATGGGTPGVVRFAAMGDTGKGNDGQKQVASAIEAKCAQSGCDFVQLLGDNIYESGATSVDDPEWQLKFEQPYAA